MSELTQISLGVIIGVGLTVWLLIAAALSDRRRHDTKPDRKEPDDHA